jgi:hypothetical protein
VGGRLVHAVGGCERRDVVGAEGLACVGKKLLVTYRDPMPLDILHEHRRARCGEHALGGGHGVGSLRDANAVERALLRDGLARRDLVDLSVIGVGAHHGVEVGLADLDLAAKRAVVSTACLELSQHVAAKSKHCD